MYELVIIGGGPGGVAAGVYAARKRIKTLLVAQEFGGQSVVSNDIKNWIGVKSISGYDLAKALEAHLRDQEGVEIRAGARVTAIAESANGFTVTTNAGDSVETKTILLANGSHHRKLGVSGEDEFNAKGVFYCSTCDAPLMNGKQAVVVGGGNSALEAVVDLMMYATRIHLLVRNAIKGDPITLEKIKNSDKVTIILGAEMRSITGDQFVKKATYFDKNDNQKKELDVEGVFVAIGSEPNSDIVKSLVQLNEYNEVVVDPATQRTSKDGIWAAGDVTDGRYKQNNVSAGDAIKAVLNIHDSLHRS